MTPDPAAAAPAKLAFDSFVIVLKGVGRSAPVKAGDFKFSRDFDAHIYKGQIQPIDVFNDVVPEIQERYKTYTHYVPQVRLLNRAAHDAAVEAKRARDEQRRAAKAVIESSEPTESTLSPEESETNNEIVIEAEPITEGDPTQSDADDIRDMWKEDDGETEEETEVPAETPAPAKKVAAKKAAPKKKVANPAD